MWRLCDGRLFCCHCEYYCVTGNYFSSRDCRLGARVARIAVVALWAPFRRLVKMLRCLVSSTLWGKTLFRYDSSSDWRCQFPTVSMPNSSSPFGWSNLPTPSTCCSNDFSAGFSFHWDHQIMSIAANTTAKADCRKFRPGVGFLLGWRTLLTLFWTCGIYSQQWLWWKGVE